MSIKEIRHFGDPVLVTSAAEVIDFPLPLPAPAEAAHSYGDDTS